MGVVRERKVECVQAKTHSNPESVHSGYTTQESEDEENADQNRPRQRQPLRTNTGLNLNFNLSITRHTGRRKVQRVLNSRFLETLKEESETDVLFENNKSAFQVIMEQVDDALEILSEYDNMQEMEKECERASRENGTENPYLKIPRKIRAAINGKKNFPFSLLKNIEENLVQFHAQHTPNSEYFYFPTNCYERMLVHAAAIYNGFFSETVIKDEKRAVKITTDKELPYKVQNLYEYIAEMRSMEIKVSV